MQHLIAFLTRSVSPEIFFIFFPKPSYPYQAEKLQENFMRITHPSYIKEGSGRMGDLVFYSLYGSSFARLYAKPANPHTEGQRMVRRTFGDAVRSWQKLADGEKHKYNRKARHLPMSGYNLFISVYMKEKLPPADTWREERKRLIALSDASLRMRVSASSVVSPYCAVHRLY
jgi:hypothetical protein